MTEDARFVRLSWIDELGDEDQQFLKRFVLASGSLKDLAAQYGISYPTVRSRLDRLIAKVKTFDALATADEFERKVRLMVVDMKMTPGTARDLIAAHQAAMKK